MESDLISLAKLIWQKLSKKRRSQLCFLLCIMVMSAAAEMLSLATLMPFIEVLINPERIWNIKVVRDAALMVRINSADNLAGPVTLIFIIASLTLAGLKIANLWLNSKLSAEVGRDFSYEVYRRIIYQPYEIYVRRRSSETITILQRELDLTVIVVGSILKLLSNGIILICSVSIRLSVLFGNKCKQSKADQK
jgi:ATP-binding cassette subfamily B protein